MKRLQAGDIDYKEATAAAAVRNKIEVDGIKAEQNAAVLKVGFNRHFQYDGKYFYVKIFIDIQFPCR